MRRKYCQLTRDHRYQIHALLLSGNSPARIAGILNFHRSTVYREINRGQVRARSAPWGRQRYQPGWAHKAYLLRRTNRFNLSRKLKIRGKLERRVRLGLARGWSPQEVSHRLKLESQKSVSHEAIYRYVLWDKELGGNLYRCLRQYGHYRKRYGRKRRFCAPVAARTPISERPAEANLRTELGHWERDLMCGRHGKGTLLTLVDRKSRYVLVEALPGKKPRDALAATIRAIHRSGTAAKSMTNDNGFEFMDHLDLTRELNLPVYFARPYASWERGSIENTNGLLRQYFPKGSDLGQATPEEILQVEKAMNLRPRRVLGYLTPYEVHHGVRQSLIS